MTGGKSLWYSNDNIKSKGALEHGSGVPFYIIICYNQILSVVLTSMIASGLINSCLLAPMRSYTGLIEEVMVFAVERKK